MSPSGQSLPIHLATVPANVRYAPNSDLSRCSFATRSAPKRIVSITPIRVSARSKPPPGDRSTFSPSQNSFGKAAEVAARRAGILATIAAINC